MNTELPSTAEQQQKILEIDRNERELLAEAHELYPHIPEEIFFSLQDFLFFMGDLSDHLNTAAERSVTLCA